MLNESKTQGGGAWSTLFDHTGEAWLLLDGDTLSILRANASAGAFLRCMPEELADRPFSEVFAQAAGSAPITSLVAEACESLTSLVDQSKFRAECFPAGDSSASGANVLLRLEPESDSVERLHFLEETVCELQGELRASSDHRMESLGLLAGGVAHDFNNLLTVIAGYAELILSHIAEDSPDHFAAAQIGDAARRATEFTQRLQAFSRRDRQQDSPTDLNEVLGSFRVMLQRIIGDRVVLEMDLHHNLPEVSGRADDLEQILTDLVFNARDAIVDRSGYVRITTCLPEELPGDLTGEYVLLTVEDDGEGIDPEMRSRIFDPFFSTKRGGPGTGLGLAVVYGLVQQVGGTIVVDSQVGDGTRINIYLPSRRRGQGEAGDGEEGDTPQELSTEETVLDSGRPTVLVVEDEEMVRALVCRAISGAGLNVLQAARGTEALSVAEAFEGDICLLVTDVVMPGMTGVELAMELLQARPATPILFMSGYTERLGAQKIVLPEDANFLQKPFRPSELVFRVKGLLN